MIDDAAKAGAARTVLGVLGGLAVVGGVLVSLYARAPQPADALVHSTVLISDQVLPNLGVQIVTRSDGGQATADVSTVMGCDGGCTAIVAHGGQPLTGSAHWRVDICTPVIDGGADPGASFLPGATVVYDDTTTDLCRDGGPVIEAWQQGRTDAPFPCACAVDATSCLQPDGGAAPQRDSNGNRVTLNPGTFTPGPGCFPKACQELGGISSWPAACP
jgi:hypothetical protein